MTPTINSFPIGDADTTRLDLADGRQILIDYADMLNRDDPYDKRCDLHALLRADLAKSKRDHFDVVCFTHIDEDHVKGASKFFWLDYSAIYQSEGRIKIKEMWVPAGALTEKNVTGDKWAIRQEARYRLRTGKGIKVFSRPDCLKELLAAWDLRIEDRKDCIVDAGKIIPGFSVDGPEHVEFFVHSPFAWRRDDRGYEERNEDSIMFQATFREGGEDTFGLFGADVGCDALSQIVQTSKKHGNADRLRWDILKLFHHCSYLSLSNDKGVDETAPAADVNWLFETQGRDGCYIFSSSRPIPSKGSKEDEDLQPPHRQAAKYYRRILDAKRGVFKVTMETPSVGRPAPMKFEVTSRGVRLLLATASAISTVTSTSARAGRAG